MRKVRLNVLIGSFSFVSSFRDQPRRRNGRWSRNVRTKWRNRQGPRVGTTGKSWSSSTSLLSSLLPSSLKSQMTHFVCRASVKQSSPAQTRRRTALPLNGSNHPIEGFRFHGINGESSHDITAGWASSRESELRVVQGLTIGYSKKLRFVA